MRPLVATAEEPQGWKAPRWAAELVAEPPGTIRAASRPSRAKGECQQEPEAL